MENRWACSKCGNTNYAKDIIQTAGGNLSKLYNIQNKKFITISCERCGYTEFFREDTSLGMNILDFLFGNK